MKAVSKCFARKALFMLSMLTFLYSANHAQNVQKDLESGLTSRGTGLACDKVYLSDGQQIIKRNGFIYGETCYVNFEDVNQQLASSLVLTGTQIANPVQFVVRVRDKNGSGWISATAEPVVE